MSSATTTTTFNQPSAGPSKSPTQPICKICSSQPSKYACPRCQARTCSLQCSKAHKSSMSCSGERDRTTYVPMNQYDYSALMNDYVFLEEIERKVEGWGKDIMKSGINVNASKGAVGMRDARGRGLGRPRRGMDRKSILAMQLSVRDVDMDILPAGMRRAGLNRSCWDMKAKRALLTLEFVFQPPPNPLTRVVPEQVTLITHRNNWDQTIRQLIRRGVKETGATKANKELLHWLNLDEEDDDVPSSILCLMKRPRSPDDPVELTPNRPSYYNLDWIETLSKSLRHKHFVEFPTIILVDEASFDGLLVDERGIVQDMEERRVKRRKLDPSEAKKTISGLLGGYGSDDDDEQQNALGTLADYSGSELSDASESEDEELEEERQSTPEEQVADEPTGMEEDDETLDWGDDEIAEDEAKLAELSTKIQQRHSAR